MHMDFPALILSLLSDDWVFFEDDEIAWDGERHKIVGIQVNGAKIHGFMDYVNQFTDFDDIQEAANFVVSFLTHLEEDEAFRIPRNRIAQGVRKAIREGDLTGITFANLVACGKAFQVTMNQEDEYICLYDTRLAMGIPHFFDLMARLIWDFRSFMKSQQGVPFDVVFMSVRNIDADEFFGIVNTPVEDHQDNPTVMHVASLPAIGGKVDSEPAPVQIETADEDAERDSILAVLNMAALTASIASNGFPQDILDDLERATNGDRSIDLDDLGRRINDLLPSIHCVDPRAWTFDCGLRAGNDLYSIAIPDGYRLIEDYQEDGLIPVTRDYVAVPESADDKDIPNCDRIIGASFMSSDSNVNDTMKKRFIEELRLAIMHASVPSGAVSFDATHYVEELVEAKNCRCAVSLVGNIGGGFEYYIRPLGAEILDYVRVTFFNEEGLSREPEFRSAVLDLARSIELSNPCMSDLQSSLLRLTEEKCSPQDFDNAITLLANTLYLSRNFETDAAQNKLKADVVSSEEQFFVSLMDHVAAFNESAFHHCERAFGALETQKQLGASDEELAAMVESVKYLHHSFESHFEPDGDSQQKILDSHGDIALPSKYWVLAESIERYSPGYFDECKKLIAEESHVSVKKSEVFEDGCKAESFARPKKEAGKEEVQKKKDNRARLKQLLAEFDCTDQKKELEKLRVEANALSDELRNSKARRESLGLFAFSEKRELDQKIPEIEKEIDEYRAKIAKIESAIKDQRVRMEKILDEQGYSSERLKGALRSLEYMNEYGNPVTAEWLAEHVPGVISQKVAVECMQTAVDWGLVKVCGRTQENKRGQTLYRPA